MSDEEFERKHPSYGILHIARTMGGTSAIRLFGSPLATHYGTIRLSISSGKWIHDLNRDRYYGMNKDLIEVEMSAAQFADAITSLNMGSGTPCTIRYVQGKRVENPPRYATEAEHIRENFKGTLDKYTAKAHTYRKKIEELTSKLSAKTKEEIRVALDVIEDQLASNVPFVVRQFQEATTRITTAAKSEVDAFVTGVVRAAGLQAIAEGRLPSLLPKHTETCSGEYVDFQGLQRPCIATEGCGLLACPFQVAIPDDGPRCQEKGQCEDIKGDGTCFGCGRWLGDDEP